MTVDEKLDLILEKLGRLEARDSGTREEAFRRWLEGRDWFLPGQYLRETGVDHHTWVHYLKPVAREVGFEWSSFDRRWARRGNQGGGEE
jgi:hypothetical protein